MESLVNFHLSLCNLNLVHRESQDFVFSFFNEQCNICITEFLDEILGFLCLKNEVFALVLVSCEAKSFPLPD